MENLDKKSLIKLNKLTLVKNITHIDYQILFFFILQKKDNGQVS